MNREETLRLAAQLFRDGIRDAFMEGRTFGRAVDDKLVEEIAEDCVRHARIFAYVATERKETP